MQNPRVLAARKLQRRSGRDAARAYLLEGPVVIAEAIEAGVPLSELFFCAEDDGAAAVAARAETAGVDCIALPGRVLDAIATTETPQGVVAVAPISAVSLESLPDVDLVLILCEIRDPGNAGTLVRSAVAAGAGTVVFSTGSVDPYSPKTVRAASGSLFRVPIVRSVDAVEALRSLSERGLKTVALDARASLAYDEADLTGSLALVVGNEAAGLDPAVLDAVDESVSIPMPGGSESLNAGVAGSVLLFEVVRRSRRPETPG